MKIGKLYINNGVAIGGTILLSTITYLIIQRRTRVNLIEQINKKLADQSTVSGDYTGLQYEAFDPRFYKDKAGAKLITLATATNFAKIIYDAKSIWNDDEDAVYSTLRKMTAKTQVSFLSDIFQRNYNVSLYAYLTSFLSSSEMETVKNIINQMTEK